MPAVIRYALLIFTGVFPGFAQNCFAQNSTPVESVETDARLVRYSITGEYAVTEGDIVLGKVDEIRRYKAQRAAGMRPFAPRSLTAIVGPGGYQLWPGGIIYYTIDQDAPGPQSIADAIEYWNTVTKLKLVPRTDEPNYVRFRRVTVDAACYSYLGMIGGAQDIGVTTNCPTGSLIHEIGHAFGLFHEQQRHDRSGNLTVLYENIDKRFISNFPQSSSNADAGYYDFDSIMHYGAFSFARNFLDTLETSPPGIPIGQRSILSTGDIDGVTRLYGIEPEGTTITTTPAGLPIIVDGVTALSPHTYQWTPGSAHTVEAPAQLGVSTRFVFARWSDGGPISHTIAASPQLTAISAQYVRKNRISAGVAEGQGYVSVFPPPEDGYVTDRVPLRIAATPTPGYQFLRWTGLTQLSGFGQGLSLNPAYVESFGSNGSYQAIFTDQPVTTVTSSPQGATVIVDGALYRTPANFAWTPGSNHALNYSAVDQIYGNNTMKLQPLGWEDGVTGLRTVTADAAGATYVARFNQQFRLSFDSTSGGFVSAAPDSPDGFYDAGTAVTLAALPLPGQSLRFWMGDVTGGAPVQSVTMDQQRDAVAYFGPTLVLRVLHSASLLPNPNVGSASSLDAPGEIVAIFAGNPNVTFGPAETLSVTFDGTPAPILFASKSQVNVVVPYSVAGQTASLVRIVAPGGEYRVFTAVEPAAVALYTSDASGTGQIAALNENGTVNSPANPALPGSVVVLYGTGAGLFDKTFPDGQILGTDLARPLLPVWVRFGKLEGKVLYAGTAPTLINGALQVNVRLPAELIGGGPVPVQLLVGSYASQPGATVSVASPE